jgi:hypothetical protein
VYDEPEFIVRNIWRLYGGWWDGNPATLKPAPERALATELAGLAGGPAALADRALVLAEQALVLAEQARAAAAEGGADAEGRPDGDGQAEQARRLAGHLAELARLAAPGDSAIADIHRQVFAARADAATSTMARGIFRWAAEDGPGPAWRPAG